MRRAGTRRKSTRGCSATRRCRPTRSRSSTPATSGWCRKPAAPPSASARRPARRPFRGFRPTARTIAYSADYDGNTDVYVVPVAGGDAGAAHPSSDGRPRDRLASRRQARAVRVGARERPAALQPVLSRRPRRRPAREAAGAVRRVRRLLAGRRALRLHADVAGLPQLEALSRRLGARPVAVRPEDVRRRATSPTTRPTTRSRCGTATRSISCPIAAPSERNNIWAEDLDTGAVRQVTQFNDFDITFPSIGPDAIVFQAGGRLYLLSLPARRNPKSRSGSSPTRSTLRARTVESRQADRRDVRRCRPPASAPPSRRAATSSPFPAERGAMINVTRSLGRRRSVSALVARRQDARLLERSQRRVRADAARRRRRPAPSARSRRSAPASGTRRSGRPTARSSRSSIRRCASASTTMATGKVTEVDKSPDWLAHDDARGVPLPVVARFALARLRAAGRHQQQRDLPVRHEGRHAAAGDVAAT